MEFFIEEDNVIALTPYSSLFHWFYEVSPSTQIFFRFFIPHATEIAAIVLLAVIEMKTLYYCFDEDKGKVTDWYNNIFRLGDVIWRTTILNIFFYIDTYYYRFYCDKSFQYETNIIDHNNMSKILLSNDKNQENKQVTNSEIVPKQQQQYEEEKEFIILKIYKSEIDKAIENLKQLSKLNQYYEPDYKLIVERSTNTILDDCGWYEILKQAIISTDHTSILERDELWDSLFRWTRWEV